MTTQNNFDFFGLGMRLAANAQYDKTAAEMAALSGFVSKIGDHKEPGYGNVQKILCKVAADAFDEAGRKQEFEYHLFEKLSHADTWLPELDKFSDSVTMALGTVSMEYEASYKQEEGDRLTKAARMLLPQALSAAGKSIPEGVKTLAGVGTLGGSVMGGLYWLLNRHSNEDEDKAEVVKAKINYYNRISDEIKKQLAQRGGVAPSAVAGEVKDVVHNQNNIL